jgi:hypothetical protein
MGRRRAARTVAVLVAVLVTSASLAMAYAPAGSAARDCCRRRCGHEAPAVPSCCCATPAAPATTPAAPEAGAATASWTTPVAVLPTTGPAIAVTSVLDALPPPGPPLFLRRCTLVL